MKTSEAKENFAHNHFHNILKLFEVLPIFFSSQVKRYAIITYKHSRHNLPHEMLNNLRLKILEN